MESVAPLAVEDLGVGRRRHDYQATWDLQRSIHADVVAGVRPPTVLLLEHQAVLTAGTRTEPGDMPTDGTDVIQVDRGGRITWHGPGQLVCYPIVPLPHPLDVVAHMRRLEEIAIRTCATFGVAAARVQGRSGAWTRAGAGSVAKIAAVGARVARGVSMHGMALNVDCDLSWTEVIVPCGIRDAETTSLAQELGRPIAMPDVAAAAWTHAQAVLGPTLAAIGSPSVAS